MAPIPKEAPGTGLGKQLWQTALANSSPFDEADFREPFESEGEFTVYNTEKESAPTTEGMGWDTRAPEHLQNHDPGPSIQWGDLNLEKSGPKSNSF